MDKKHCGYRHFFVIDRTVQALNDLHMPLRCKRCGCIYDNNISQEEYDTSYYEDMCSAWDSEVMHRSKIASFEISYVIEVDRYQIVQYSPNKLVCKKTWGGCTPRRGWVEKAQDWQNPLEFSLSENEDQAIHSLLENTAFETWEPSTDRMHDCMIGAIGCHSMPGFSCTFKDHNYVYFKTFYHNHQPWSMDDMIPKFGEDVTLESPFIDLLNSILKSHGFDLPSIDLGFSSFL